MFRKGFTEKLKIKQRSFSLPPMPGCNTYGDDSVSTFQRLSDDSTPRDSLVKVEEEGSRATYVKHSCIS
jgi:hypothetical protein